MAEQKGKNKKRYKNPFTMGENNTTNKHKVDSSKSEESIVVEQKKNFNSVQIFSRKRNSKAGSKKFSFKKFFKYTFMFSIITTILVGSIGLGYAYITWQNTPDIKSFDFWKNQDSSFVYDREGNMIGSLSPESIRWVSLKDKDGNYNVSEDYINAIIAIEDRTFYEHHGINWIGMGRAVLSGGDKGGGSSLTMQLAKNLYLLPYDKMNPLTGEIEEFDPRDSGIKYKLTQMMLAWKIENIYTKDQILENYINTAYFGSECGFGIVNATDCFYGKDPKELTVSEAAGLAGIPNMPGLLNPYRTSKDANGNGTENDEWDFNATGAVEYVNRKNLILDAMLENKKLSKAQYDKAQKEDIVASLKPKGSFKSLEPSPENAAYLSMVRDELEEVVFKNQEFDIGSAGMEIHTNMDPKLQKRVYGMMEKNEMQHADYSLNFPDDDKLQALAMSMDTQTGAIYAGNGLGRHPSKFGGNLLRTYHRQPGSTAKPVTAYAPAIEYLDWSTGHILNDKKMTFSDGTPFYNWDYPTLGARSWNGPMTMASGLARSKNTTAVLAFQETMAKIGPEAYTNWMSNLGFSDFQDDETHVYEPMAIGGWENGATMYEMTSAFAAFGNGGYLTTPHTIEYIKINDNSKYRKLADDKGIYRPDETIFKRERVMGEDTAFMMTQMMNPKIQGAVAPPVSGPVLIDGELNGLAVKTGTSNFDDTKLSIGIPDGATRDEWEVGLTPEVTVGVWTGFFEADESGTHNLNLYGGGFPNWHKGMFRYMMTYYLENKPDYYDYNSTYKQPDNIEQICGRNSSSCGEFAPWYIKGSADSPNKNSLKKPAEKPIMSVNDTTLSWNIPNSYGELKWTINVENKQIAQVTDKQSYTIDMQKIIDTIGCQSRYEVSLVLEDSMKQDPSEPAIGTITNNVSSCKSQQKNQPPIIFYNTSVTIKKGAKINPKTLGANAIDTEDGNLTESIELFDNNIKSDVPGTYSVRMRVKDKGGLTYETGEIKVIVE
ncbi:MAG: transglycosylase domain-containing protein [Mycoplasmatales bacterium]